MALSAGTVAVGAGAASASVQPDITCPGNTVCLWQNDDLTGNFTPLFPGVDGNEWLSTNVVAPNGAKNHAGSVRNNTTDIVWVYAKDSGDDICISATKFATLDRMYGFVQIKTGVSSCKGQTLPKPLP
jgi:hypothetical protein